MSFQDGDIETLFTTGQSRGQFGQNNAICSLSSRLPPVTPQWPVLPAAAENPGCSLNVFEVGAPMDSLQGLLSDQRHKDTIASLVPGPAGVRTRSAGQTRDPDAEHVSTTTLSQLVDATAEETCPPNAAQISAQDGAPPPAVKAAQAPSITTFELMNQLDALAGDLAAKERASSDQRIENVREDSNASAGMRVAEPSIHVTPRPAGFENELFANDRSFIGRRSVVALALVALIGAGAAYAWQSHRAWKITSSSDATVATEQPNSVPAQAAASAAIPAQPAPVPQTAAAPAPPAISPELQKQLEAIAQDLAFVRRSVEQLTAKQAQLAAAQQRLEQLAAKQEQTAQNIAKLQTREQNIRQKMPPPQSRVAPLPPRVSLEPATQLSSTPLPRSEPHPLPPLPIPP